MKSLRRETSQPVNVVADQFYAGMVYMKGEGGIPANRRFPLQDMEKRRPGPGSNPSTTRSSPPYRAPQGRNTITWMKRPSPPTQISVKRQLAQTVADEVVHSVFRKTPNEAERDRFLARISWTTRSRSARLAVKTCRMTCTGDDKDEKRKQSGLVDKFVEVDEAVYDFSAFSDYATASSPDYFLIWDGVGPMTSLPLSKSSIRCLC